MRFSRRCSRRSRARSRRSTRSAAPPAEARPRRICSSAWFTRSSAFARCPAYSGPAAFRCWRAVSSACWAACMSGCSSARTARAASKQRGIRTSKVLVIWQLLSSARPRDQTRWNGRGGQGIAPAMATVITSECINCGACEPECPNTAIYQGAVEWQAPDGSMHPPVSNDIFYIVPEKCTECVGFHDHEACAAVCPVDCCVPAPNIPETHAVLLARARALHPTAAIPAAAPSRFKKEGGPPAAPAATPAAEAKPMAPAPAAAPPAAAPSAETIGLAIPSLEEWEIPIRCFRCSGDYTVPFKYFRAGTVFYCPHCQGSLVPTLGMVRGVED